MKKEIFFIELGIDNIVRVNDPQTSIDGTFYVGQFPDLEYSHIVSILGEPREGDGYKVDAEWTLERAGVVATLYNWKNGHNYNGEGIELDLEHIPVWNVGGRSLEAFELVKEVLGL